MSDALIYVGYSNVEGSWSIRENICWVKNVHPYEPNATLSLPAFHGSARQSFLRPRSCYHFQENLDKYDIQKTFKERLLKHTLSGGSGSPLYFDTLNSWYSWHFTDSLNQTFLTYGTKKKITQSLAYNGSCGSCVFEACNSYHFYISTEGPSENIMVHNENSVNQKDNILLKPFLYVIT